MEVPVLQLKPASKIHLVGGEKGGVGKSVVARLLAQHFIDQQLPFVGFDTDRSHGSLLRFYAGYASPALVDRYEALDRIIESAVDQPGRRVLVDLAAQTDEPLMKWIDESGVLDMAELSDIALHYWHVMDTGRDSVVLLERLLNRFGQRMTYVVVCNEVRGDDFSLLEHSGQLARVKSLGGKVLRLKRLHDGVMQKIDACSASFWAAANTSGSTGPGLGLMERQRLRMWLHHAHAQLASVEP